MKKISRLYKYGMNIKMHTALYSIALLIIISMVKLLQGINSIEVSIVFQVFIVSLVLGFIDLACFPIDKKLIKEQFIFNSIIWIGCANFLFIPSAIVFNWFEGLSIFFYSLILFILEIGLMSILYGLYVEYKY